MLALLALFLVERFLLSSALDDGSSLGVIPQFLSSSPFPLGEPFSPTLSSFKAPSFLCSDGLLLFCFLDLLLDLRLPFLAFSSDRLLRCRVLDLLRLESLLFLSLLRALLSFFSPVSSSGFASFSSSGFFASRMGGPPGPGSAPRPPSL